MLNFLNAKAVFPMSAGQKYESRASYSIWLTMLVPGYVLHLKNDQKSGPNLENHEDAY